MENNIDLNLLIKTLNERFYESLKHNSTRIFNIVPYTRNGKQLCIVITETNGTVYSANVHYGDVKFPKEYNTNNIDLFLRYTLENDKSFFNEIIQKAKDDIDIGLYDKYLYEDYATTSGTIS